MATKIHVPRDFTSFSSRAWRPGRGWLLFNRPPKNRISNVLPQRRQLRVPILSWQVGNIGPQNACVIKCCVRPWKFTGPSDGPDYLQKVELQQVRLHFRVTTVLLKQMRI